MMLSQIAPDMIGTGFYPAVSDMPKSKQWRFRPDAWEIFEEKYGDYIARMLNDTRYMSKLAREYLTSVIEPEKILTVTGSATSMLRAKWGLDAILDDSSPLQFGGESESSAAKAPKAPVKNREDHRHHAIDAFVISSLNRKLISAISQCAKRAEQAHLENLFKAIPRAYERISYEKLEAAVKSINVSHKLDRGDAKGALKRGGTVAKLHKETAYGMIGSPYGGKATLAEKSSDFVGRMRRGTNIGNSQCENQGGFVALLRAGLPRGGYEGGKEIHVGAAAWRILRIE